MQTRLARKKTQELGQMAKKHKLVDDVTRQKSEEVIRQAKKKGYQISEKIVTKSSALKTKLRKGAKTGIQGSVNARKKLGTSAQKELELLEKLGELHKAGIITNREFQEKKKKILSKI